MKTRIVLLLMLGFLTACSRPEGTAKIRIQMPEQNLSAKPAAVAQRSGKVSAQNNDSGWGVPTPNSINDFNCYAVFIGGSEPEMRNKSCTKGSGASFERFFFNNVAGMTAAGNVLALDVNSGLARSIYVVGVKSQVACSSMEFLDSSQVSNPLVLGQAQVDLVPGDNNISLTAKLATDVATQTIQDCNFGSTANNGGPPTKLGFRGPIESYDPAYESKLGSSTCNRVRIELQNAQSGSAYAEVPVAVNLSTSTSSGILGFFSGNPTCSSGTLASVTIPPGQRFVDVFFKAHTSTGTGSVSAAASLGGGVLSATKSVGVEFSSTAASLRFFEDRINLAPNTCTDVYYWGVDASQRTAVTGAGLTLGSYGLDGLGQSLASLTGSSITDVCGGTTLSTLPAGVAQGSFSFRLGNDAKDFQIGVNSTPYSLVKVNVQPRATSLSLSTLNPSPYASACTEVKLQALNISSLPADLSGNDSSPWALPKRILAQFYKNGGTSNVMEYLVNCSATSGGSSEVTLTVGAPSASKYVRFSSLSAVEFRGWGGSFINGPSSETLLTVNPQWDPGVFQSSSQVAYFVPQLTGGNLAGTVIPTVSNNGIGTMAVAGPIAVSVGSLGTGSALEFSGSNAFFPGALSNSGTLSFSMLVRFPSIPAVTEFITVMSSAGTVASLTSVGLNQLALNSRHASVSTLGAAVNISPNTWMVLTVVRNPTGLCKFWVNKTLGASAACDSANQINNFTVSASAGFSFSLGEFFIVHKALSAAEVAQNYDYLRVRYPSAGLAP